MNASKTPGSAEEWRLQIERDGIANGLTLDVARWVAENVGDSKSARAARDAAKEIVDLTRIVGAPQLAGPMVRAGFSADIQRARSFLSAARCPVTGRMTPTRIAAVEMELTSERLRAQLEARRAQR